MKIMAFNWQARGSYNLALTGGGIGDIDKEPSSCGLDAQ